MNKVKICLDAGHVGSRYNQSPVVKTYYESAAMWSLHLKLKAALEALGFEVVTTRASIDTKMDVYDRGAASKGCDVFLSLHSNACGTESVDYPVVYRAYDGLNGSDVLAGKLAARIGAEMGTAQAGRTAIRKNSAGNEYYGVLRGARAVGTPQYLLVEHSFHTNARAAQWLLSDIHLAGLALAEAEVLAEHYGLSAVPEGKTAILGMAQATAQQMALFCRSRNAAPRLPACSVEELAQMFLEEGAAEGVRGDVAWAQSLKETGFFRYGGIVLPEQNNYAGIGALNGNAQGQAATFPDPRIGVRAQIQHLKAYVAARTAMMSMTNSKGEPLGLVPDKLVVPPALEKNARDILVADYINGTRNTMQGTAKPVVVPRLAGKDSAWYLLCTTRPIKPLIYQQRKKAKFVSLTSENDANVFMKKQFLYGVDCRGNAGFGFWQMAYGSDGSANS